MRKRRISAGFLWLLAPSLAFASDFSGFVSGLVIFTIGSLSAVIGLASLILEGFGGSYRKYSYARNHAIAASIIPVLGFAAMLLEGSSVRVDHIAERLVFNSIALALALSPLLLHRLRFHGKGTHEDHDLRLEDER